MWGRRSPSTSLAISSVPARLLGAAGPGPVVGPQGLVVGLDAGRSSPSSYTSSFSTTSTGSRGLTSGSWSRHADAQSETRDRRGRAAAAGRPPSGGRCGRRRCNRCRSPGPRPHHRVLGGQGDVDGGDDELLGHAGCHRAARHLTGQRGPVEVGTPDEEGAGGLDLALAPGDLGDGGPGLRVADPDHGGGLQVRGGGGGLGAADQVGDDVVSQRFVDELPDRAVGAEQVVDLVHGVTLARGQRRGQPGPA